MQINVCTLHHIILFILFSVIIAREANINKARWNEPSIKSVLRSVDNNAHDGPSRLITAHPLVKEEWLNMPILPQGLNSQTNIADSFPVQSAASISKASIDSQKQHVENNMPYERPSIHPQTASASNHESPLLSKGTNATVKRESIAPQGTPNKTEESEKPSAGDAPAKPPDTVLSSDQALNHSASQTAAVNGQRSKLLVSLQTVNGAQIHGTNVSGIGSVANATGNRSAVLITNTREIEVVIIAEKSPHLAQETTTEFQRSLVSEAPSRRFPSGILYANGTFVEARRPQPSPHPSRHYWAVYLTMTMLCLSVVAICVVCCTSQGRRDMSFPPPKTVQYGQQLPPYSYAFSYDMRQAESQEAARLNPTNP